MDNCKKCGREKRSYSSGRSYCIYCRRGYERFRLERARVERLEAIAVATEGSRLDLGSSAITRLHSCRLKLFSYEGVRYLDYFALRLDRSSEEVRLRPVVRDVNGHYLVEMVEMDSEVKGES